MKLNLNENIKALLIQEADEDSAKNGESKALSHYANMAIAEYFKHKQTIRQKDTYDKTKQIT